MWLNYLKTALRNINRSKFFSLINIVGLTFGIAAFIIIMIYVEFEFSYDKHFKNADRIYRVTLDMEWSQAPTQYTAIAPGPIAHFLATEYPEVIAGTRFTFLDRHYIEYKPSNVPSSKKGFYEEQIMAVDSNFFKVFDLRILNSQLILN